MFYGERPDPLDGDRVNRVAWMDAFVGNPPFMGGSHLSGTFGAAYLEHLLGENEGAHGNADLSVYFLRRAFRLLGRNGGLGLITTNTIAQGDTKASGLAYILSQGGAITRADRSFPWPGDAGVSVSIVHICKGFSREFLPPAVLDGCAVGKAINSSLADGVERDAPSRLIANASLYSQGVHIYGQGFLLTPEEKDDLLRDFPDDGAVISKYVGGEDVNSSPTLDSSRWVIGFGSMSLEEAERFQGAMAVVRQRVKPDRDALKDTPINRRLKQYWWRYWADRPEFSSKMRAMERCLVTSGVTKHLCFSFQPSNRMLSQRLYMFLLDRYCHFSIMQSRVHAAWACRLSSTLQENLSYAAADGFGTFAFPAEDPRAPIVELETVGERLYSMRAQYMVDATAEESKPVGLTTTYNRLKDPGVNDPRIMVLRALHEEMDRAVCTAYGWKDLAARVPSFCVASAEDQRALDAFESEVIDRLYELNARRADEERGSEAAAHKGNQAKKGTRDAGIGGQGTLGIE